MASHHRVRPRAVTLSVATASSSRAVLTASVTVRPSTAGSVSIAAAKNAYGAATFFDAAGDGIPARRASASVAQNSKDEGEVNGIIKFGYSQFRRGRRIRSPALFAGQDVQLAVVRQNCE